MRGVGPPSRAWEARVIAVIRHPQSRKENSIYRYGKSISVVNINFLTMLEVEFPYIVMRRYYIASKNMLHYPRRYIENRYLFAHYYLAYLVPKNESRMCILEC